MRLIFGLIGGLGLFLYGMQLMGDGLQKTAGDRLRRLLEVLTSTPVVGVLVGALVTMVVQSSSATTVMVVGFVNAGLLTLKQAISVIMGANIGTTATALIVSLKLTELALPAIGIGFLLHLAGKRKSTRFIGQTILGFGILFLGMEVMGDTLQPLRDHPIFTSLLLDLSQHPFLGMLAGMGFTAVVQSSSATTGLVVTLAAQGLIDLNASLAIILGANIGTTATALLAAIGAHVTARRAAIAHLLFNVFGVAVFMLLFRPFVAFVGTTHQNLARQVANAHIIFNLVNTLLLLPLITPFVRLVERLVPGRDDLEQVGALYLDERLIDNPSIALGQATRELVRMGRLAQSMLADVYASFQSSNTEKLAQAADKESTINYLEQAVIAYLVKVSRQSLSNEQSNRLNALLSITNDIERMGDHAENIGELAQYRHEHRLPFSDEAMAELDDIYGRVFRLVERVVSILDSGDLTQATAVLAGEDDIDQLERNLRRHHIERLNTGTCYPASGVVYLDLISNFERIADHANDTTESLTAQTTTGNSPTGVSSLN